MAGTEFYFFSILALSMRDEDDHYNANIQDDDGLWDMGWAWHDAVCPSCPLPFRGLRKHKQAKIQKQTAKKYHEIIQHTSICHARHPSEEEET